MTGRRFGVTDWTWQNLPYKLRKRLLRAERMQRLVQPEPEPAAPRTGPATVFDALYFTPDPTPEEIKRRNIAIKRSRR